MGAHKPILTESLLSFPIIFNMQWVSLFAISSVIVCSMHNRIFKSLPKHSCEHSQGCFDRSGGSMSSNYFHKQGMRISSTSILHDKGIIRYSSIHKNMCYERS